ncbi:MAG: hypothetical protein IH621_18515, partial [Krumholzibacteria bacterium]|nr:hypothetical protein [Candidatus Krumholzibacteria bacterium]
MSTRQLLTKTTGALGLLSALALIAVAVTWNPGRGDTGAAALALQQQGRVADLDRQLAALVAAEDFAAVNAARAALGRTVLDFDRAQEALVRGGAVAAADGSSVRIGPVRGDEARRALAGASAIWLQVGMPLADLSAGEFSVFSAAGQQAIRDLRQSSLELTSHLATVAAACGNTGSGPGRPAQAA